MRESLFCLSLNTNLDSTIVIGFSLHWYANEPSQKVPLMEHDLTRGNVLKTIAVFALPYMLSYFLQMLYGHGRPVHDGAV